MKMKIKIELSSSWMNLFQLLFDPIGHVQVFNTRLSFLSYVRVYS